MSRNTEYQFISTDTDALVAKLISAYEKITGAVVHPASPEKLFIMWVADVILQERVINNYTGNQNLPSRAEGPNLDALGDIFYIKTRPAAQAAFSTLRLFISAPQATAVLIPAGTRATDAGNTLIWETTADVFVPIGELHADVMIQCQSVGLIGNGYAPGQINTLIDLFNYYDHCENVTTSDGGADAATDDEFFELMRAGQDAYSTAGPRGAYIYFAKQVSTEIADVLPNSPSDGQVNLYVLMKDGTIAGDEIKNAVLAACNPDDVRPLADRVVVDDPEVVSFNIEFTYYIARETPMSATEIEAAVNAAVAKYVAWQSARLGRDITPDYLEGLLMQTGIKRKVVTSPIYTPLRDGLDNTVPQVGLVGSITIINGGYEDE